MLSEKDLQQLDAMGISPDAVHRQLEDFKRGFPFADIQAPATAGKGIRVIGKDSVQNMVSEYDDRMRGREVIKFVPASGAATRMFKDLLAFREAGEDKLPDDHSKGLQSLSYLFGHIREAAFSDELDAMLASQGKGLEDSIRDGEYARVLDTLLTGMEYEELPKGLLTFHSEGGEPRLACEEHLVEGALYASDDEDWVRIHFTVSPEHLERFREAIGHAAARFMDRFGVLYDISYSIQKPSTDTIAATIDNEPFRDEDGSLVFRPGGHGALIENLNDLGGDIIFIKNIDNVVPDRLKDDTVTWKKVIGAELFRIEARVHAFLDEIDEEGLSDDMKIAILRFVEEECGLKLAEEERAGRLDEEFFRSLLNRPIRVCGMVPNEGEPGGGPFWVKGQDGRTSLQIVESAQIDMQDKGKMAILQASTHFNPVDLVCSVRDYQGQPFDLRDFVDPMTGFISLKSKGGRDLKALELPGLWNGAMAGWLTAFIEVPLITFNPVKTVNDLLREQHKSY